MRGLGLFRDRGTEIVTYLDGTFGVPSRTEPDVIYHVDLERGTCECFDHLYRGTICLHIFAAMIFRAKALAKRMRRVAGSPRRRCSGAARRAA